MSLVAQLEQLKESSEQAFNQALAKEAEKQNKIYESIIKSFIDDLNSRYKRHCFVFDDGMGQKYLSLYHRVTNELIYCWDTKGVHDSVCNSKVKTESNYRSLHETKLGNEIDSVLSALIDFENAFSASHCFFWNGKSQYDYVTDAYKK